MSANVKFIEIGLTREDENNLIFVSSEMISELFVALKSDEEVLKSDDALRRAIESCLKAHFEKDGAEASVFTNGSMSGPVINSVVKITNR